VSRLVRLLAVVVYVLLASTPCLSVEWRCLFVGQVQLLAVVVSLSSTPAFQLSIVVARRG